MIPPFALYALILYVLAILDCAAAGYRAAAGRNALIRKKGYYRLAVLRGALLGHLPVAAMALLAYGMYWAEGAPDYWFSFAGIVMQGMLTVYVPYAAVMIAALLVRLIPNVDIRSLMSVLVFGPGTLLRPFVMIGGVLYGLSLVSTAGMQLLGGAVLVFMLGFENALEPFHRARPEE